MKHINKISLAKIKKETKLVIDLFLNEKTLLLFTGFVIQGLLILALTFSKEGVTFNLFIAMNLVYLIAVKMIKKQTNEVIIWILVFGFTFRFTISISHLFSEASISQSAVNLYQNEHQVFKFLSSFLKGDLLRQLMVKTIIFLFEFMLIMVLLHIYRKRKHFFLHYFWNIPIIYEFYYKPNLIVVFLFFFFLALYLSLNKKRILSSISLAVSFFFNFGIFPFFAFFYKKIKWWLVLTALLSMGLIFIAGYYKILFAYMTTFQEIERGFISLLSFLRWIVPHQQVVLLLYYSFIISVIIYFIIREVYIFDSIYYFLITLLLINPNKELSFVSFLLSFMIIFPNMGVIYFSIFLFVKTFLAKMYLSEAQLVFFQISGVVVLYSFHIKKFFEYLNTLYKRTLKKHKELK